MLTSRNFMKLQYKVMYFNVMTCTCIFTSVRVSYIKIEFIIIKFLNTNTIRMRFS